MTEAHPNVSLLKRLDLRNLAAAKDVIAEDVVWHFFNPICRTCRAIMWGWTASGPSSRQSEKTAKARSGLSPFRSRLSVKNWSSPGIGTR